MLWKSTCFIDVIKDYLNKCRNFVVTNLKKKQSEEFLACLISRKLVCREKFSIASGAELPLNLVSVT